MKSVEIYNGHAVENRFGIVLYRDFVKDNIPLTQQFILSREDLEAIYKTFVEIENVKGK